MADNPTPPDYRDTVFLPKTGFPMKAGLPQKEPAILERWQKLGLYERLREKRAGREKFILHDGPPYANGDMHIGHALNHILKDAVCRTQTLLGKDAPYVPGWDCHGLPIEWKVEEQYRAKKKNKDEVPLPEFRAECRAYAQAWVDVQREQIKRLGVLGAWDRPYLTMDFDAEATIVSELLKFAESGQLYRGAKPVMWSPVEKTALAEAEVEYEDIVSTQIDVAFPIANAVYQPYVRAHGHEDVIKLTMDRIARIQPWLANASAVVWTTTPWTIPVNQALAYNDNVRYALVDAGTRKLLIAEELVEAAMSRIGGSYTVFDTVIGSEIGETTFRHPMHHLGGFFAKPRPFLAGDFVTTDQGTGLVHMAPDHGEDDFELCKANGLEPVFAVEGDGKYRADWGWLGGQGSVINPKFNAPDGPICSDLRDAGALLAASQDYKHSYPHSWRSKAKVIFRATAQWFVPMDKPLEGAQNTVRAEPVEALSSSSSDSAEEKGGLRQAQAERSLGSNPSTLRQRALSAIDATRFVPDKGRNRIGSMVEGRPDWVLSRQRAWGVPITLFVDRKTGRYLTDPEVNARIVAAVRENGVDAWSDENAQNLLGNAYRAEDYERVTDILDVWFDSGCTHVFVLESGKWPELQWPADLYLEGSDQHRGWFQSSLLESCGTRGRAPYKAVLTHGFTMDAKGMKMSKSLGNTVDPLKLMTEYGADIIRLWALSIDFTEDHRIGKEILAGVADQYRKLRNTFRYLLGALEGFDDAERTSEFPELERYVLHRLAELDAELRQCIDDFEFSRYVRLLSDFANEDLSAFLFDIRKDCLYCDAPSDPKRRAYRTVLDILFNALVRWLAPVLTFTTEEVWQTRWPDENDSVHFAEWPEIEAGWLDAALGAKWERIRQFRSATTEAIEPLRRDKQVGSSLEARVQIDTDGEEDAELLRSVDFQEIAITSEMLITSNSTAGSFYVDPITKAHLKIERVEYQKCGRCWRHLPEVTEDGGLCDRCTEVVGA